MWEEMLGMNDVYWCSNFLSEDMSIFNRHGISGELISVYNI